MSLLSKLFKSEDEKLIKKLAPIVEEVFALEDGLKNISDAELKDKSIALKNKIRDEIIKESKSVYHTLYAVHVCKNTWV